jgi:hypothetical protein
LFLVFGFWFLVLFHMKLRRFQRRISYGYLVDWWLFFGGGFRGFVSIKIMAIFFEKRACFLMEGFEVGLLGDVGMISFLCWIIIKCGVGFVVGIVSFNREKALKN